MIESDDTDLRSCHFLSCIFYWTSRGRIQQFLKGEGVSVWFWPIFTWFIKKTFGRKLFMKTIWILQVLIYIKKTKMTGNWCNNIGNFFLQSSYLMWNVWDPAVSLKQEALVHRTPWKKAQKIIH